MTNTLEFGNRQILTSHHPLIKVPLAFRRSVESVTTWTNHSQGVKFWHCLQFLAGAALLSQPALGAPYLLLLMLQSDLSQGTKQMWSFSSPYLVKHQVC